MLRDERFDDNSSVPNSLPNSLPSSLRMSSKSSSGVQSHPSQKQGESYASLDLVWLLKLEEKGKSEKCNGFLNKKDTCSRSVVEENKIIDYLCSQSFTIGLARFLIHNIDACAARIWLIDNSSSMHNVDGNKVIQQANNKIMSVPCTRWEEVTSTLLWHANFVALLKAPTAIQMVQTIFGQPRQLGIALSNRADLRAELSQLSMLLRQKPSGTGCDLLSRLKKVVDSCLAIPIELLETKKGISLLYVTDRLPVDENGSKGEHATNQFLNIIKMLSNFPIWVIIRLSTYDQDVVDYYSELVSINMKSAERVNLEVMDDFFSEAALVNVHNPWLNYAYPLHLCREAAVNSPMFNLLNCRPLTHGELVKFLNLLFDLQQPLTLRDPKSNYIAFRTEVKDLVKRRGRIYNPIKRRLLPWIDIGLMDKQYGSHVRRWCHIL